MQTFLPYPNFTASVQCLDYRRLGKQRVEASQLLGINRSTGTKGWANHPASKMWVGYYPALALYMSVCVREWERRGYHNTMEVPYAEDGTPRTLHYSVLELPNVDGIVMPPWLGDEKFHSSHRAALLHKDPEWYGQFEWEEEPKLDYVWPV